MSWLPSKQQHMSPLLKKVVSQMRVLRISALNSYARPSQALCSVTIYNDNEQYADARIEHTPRGGSHPWISWGGGRWHCSNSRVDQPACSCCGRYLRAGNSIGVRCCCVL